jgi:NADH-quinone oxidoreductase subunit F
LVIRAPNPFPSVCARVCNHPCEDRCRSGTTGGKNIAIRALKRFITDRIDPNIYKPAKLAKTSEEMPKVAIIGAGPAGLSAAHLLSLNGYKVTIFEAEKEPGGMLYTCIPNFRLPRDILRKEIDALIDENITLKCNTALGRDMTLDNLFISGFKAIFLAIGAHKSWRLGIEGEDVEGVYTSLKFLKAYNLEGKNLAKGKVVVIGGGNTAVDTARVAVRQKGVESVTILYRRTRVDMPALEEDIEMALQEGIKLETLMSLETLITPIKIHTKNGKVIGLECLKNELGNFDSSGRRRPIPIPNTEHIVPLDSLIVAIGEAPEISDISAMGIKTSNWDTVQIDTETLSTNHPGVFAGGDLVTGPNTVVDAIAAGKRAALMITRYLRGEDMKKPIIPKLPDFYIEPPKISEEEIDLTKRIPLRTIPVELRRDKHIEVEQALSVEEATWESRRCLRCDLEFTKPE